MLFFLGGWQGRGTFKVTFNSGGATEFAQHFKCAVASGEIVWIVWIDVNKLVFYTYKSNAHLSHVTVGVAYAQVQLSSCFREIQLRRNCHNNYYFPE